MTGAQMCEYIATWIKRTTGEEINPEAIWNMSPTGELYPVYELYWTAKAQTEQLDTYWNTKTYDLVWVPKGEAPENPEHLILTLPCPPPLPN